MKELSNIFLRVGHTDVLLSCSSGLYTLSIHQNKNTNNIAALAKVIQECMSDAKKYLPSVEDRVSCTRALSRLEALSRKLDVTTSVSGDDSWCAFQEDLGR